MKTYKAMDILTFSKQLESRMKERLNEFSADQDEILKAGHVLTFIREIIAELKQFCSSYKFTDESEEIKFFKEIKPVFLSQFFFYKKVFALRLFDSFKDLKTRQSNYYKILQHLERFVQKNLEFYEYCMTSTTYLDKHYFTRNRQNHKSIDRDEKFSTGYDTKLAAGDALSFETQGRAVADALSGASLGFDSLGNLLVGGGDFFGSGDVGYAAIVDADAVAAALGGGPIAPDSAELRLTPRLATDSYSLRFRLSESVE